MAHAQTPRPNPAVRRDWERTRAEFEAYEASLASERAAQAHSAKARAALAYVERRFPATPVASSYERRFRRAYLARVAATAQADLTPEKFDDHIVDMRTVGVTFLALFASWVAILVTTIQASYSTPATIVWTLTQIVLSFLVVGLPVAWIFSLAFNAIHKRRLSAMLADRNAYFRWLDYIQAQSRALDAVCVCSYRNRIHDADCPALTLD